jgi:molecular chaperone HtpG
MTPILGIIASSFRSAAGPDGAYDALATVTVPSGGLASITFAAIPNTYKITINANHPLISKIADLKDESEQKALAKQISDLALLSQNLLTGADLTAFIKRTVGGF